MAHQEFSAPSELRNTIRCFWYDKRDFGPSESSREIMPDGYAEIIFHFGGECRISHDGISQPLPSPCLVGLLNQPAVLYTKNVLEIIGIRCYPWTVFDLLGLPAGRNTMRIVDHPIARLQPTLHKCIAQGKIEDAVAEVRHYFMEAHARIDVDSLLFKAGVAMTKANGTLPVRQVASAAHATVRTLERKFKQSSGHTVKDVSALMRFEQVRNQLWLTPQVNLAGLAHELGYTDQSHLSREFKRYSGTTPGAFARKAKNVSSDFVAFVQA